MTATAAPPAKLSAAQARALHLADVKVRKLRAELEEAEKAQSKLRTRYRARVPLSEDPEERAKGVRFALVGGLKVRVTPVAGSDRFSLRDYKALGHKVTAAMRDAMKRSDDFDRWTINDARGPKTADAVEPRP